MSVRLSALAIERAAGDTYPNLAERYIFRPIGMRNSYFHGDPQLAKVAVAPNAFAREAFYSAVLEALQ